MQRLIIAIGLLVVSVYGQGGPPSGPPAPASAAGPAPASQEKDMKQDPCPPRTGREWICMVDWWDNSARRVVRSEERQKCDERDLCYLGPIENRRLNGAWERRWMCGIRPCEMRTERGTEMVSCPRGHECTMDFMTIMLNGNVTAQAKFCTKMEDSDDMDDMDEMTEPMWAPPICSVNSSVDNFMANINPCDPGESCGRGPVNIYDKGTQYRLYMCTHTPSGMMMQGGSFLEKMQNEMHMQMMKLSTALVMGGHVWNRGPFMTMKELGGSVRVLFNNLMYLEEWSREMGEEKMKVPEYVKDLFEDVYVNAVKLHVEVLKALPAEGDKMMKALRRPFEEVEVKIMGIPDVRQMIKYIHENLQWVGYFIQHNDIKHPEFAVAFRSLRETMMHTYYIASEELKNPRVLEMMERMDGEGVQMLWNLRTGGPTAPDQTPSSIFERIINMFNQIQDEISAGVSVEDRVHDIWMVLEKLREAVRDGRLMEEGKEMLMMLSERLMAIKRMANSLPDGNRLSRVMAHFAKAYDQLWNHATGGFFYPDSSPNSQVSMMMDGLEDLKDALEEADRMRRGPQDGPERPNGMQNGQQMPRGNMDLLDEIRRSMSDLERRMMGGDDNNRDNRDMGPAGRIIDAMRQLHRHLAEGERIPDGPERLVMRMSEELRRIMDEADRMSDRLERGLDMVRRAIMRLTDFFRDRRGDPGDIFEDMIEGMMSIVENREQNNGRDDLLQTLRNMRNGGQGGQQPRPPMGGNDDMMRQFNDMQRRMMDFMEMMMNNDRGMRGNNNMRGDNMMGNNMMGNNMMGNNMMGNNMMRNNMMGNNMMDDKDEPCEEPFWAKQIPRRDHSMWGRTERGFYGDMMMDDDNDRN